MKSKHQRRVEEFMRLAGQNMPKVATMPDGATRELRANLILEEALETIIALGCSIRVGSKGFECFVSNDYEPNLIEIIDGCCDISVVTVGTMIALGLPMEPFLEEVDANNIAKGNGGYVRDDGKFMKPTNHPKPDIAGVLEKLK
jgi:predicted HAD superfamily Cof-like phosphohydrolase